MKFFVVVLVLSLIAGLHAARQKMTNWGFDLFCPHSAEICNCGCQSWGFDSGVCEGPGKSQCWCYFAGTRPSLGGKRKLG